MELYQLKTFIKVAALKNLSRAAEALNTSQPAVSAHIKSLEEELKVPLFIRTPRGMEITPDGEKLNASAENIFLAVDQMINQSIDLQQKQTYEIRIGTNTYPEVIRINELLTECTKEEENIIFTISHRMSYQIKSDIRDSILDCGFAFGDNFIEGLEQLNLAQIPMRIIGPKNWEQDLERCSLDELLKFPWIFMYPDCPFYDAANKVLKGRLSKLNIFSHVDDEDQILNLVASGLGISIIPEASLQIPGKSDKLYIHPDLGMKVNLSFHYLKQREKDPAIAVILKKLSHLWF